MSISSSAPKYNLLYEAFGWEIPIYMHCPPVMKDATHKLSKRNGDASYQDLVAQGYLKEASPQLRACCWAGAPRVKRKSSLPEMIEAFDIHGISKSPAIFDTVKLRFLNG